MGGESESGADVLSPESQSDVLFVICGVDQHGGDQITRRVIGRRDANPFRLLTRQHLEHSRSRPNELAEWSALAGEIGNC